MCSPDIVKYPDIQWINTLLISKSSINYPIKGTCRRNRPFFSDSQRDPSYCCLTRQRREQCLVLIDSAGLQSHQFLRQGRLWIVETPSTYILPLHSKLFYKHWYHNSDKAFKKTPVNRTFSIFKWRMTLLEFTPSIFFHLYFDCMNHPSSYLIKWQRLYFIFYV